MNLLKQIKQASTWEGFITAATSIALIVDAVTTGGAITGILGALGAIASATSIVRDDSVPDAEISRLKEVAEKLHDVAEITQQFRDSQAVKGG